MTTDRVNMPYTSKPLRAIESHETYVGKLVIWLHRPRGGYGYAIPVEAKIIALNLQGNRMIIAVKTKSGQTVKRRVQLENLRTW